MSDDRKLPRYTADPVPDGIDPATAAYIERELQRIHDLWPYDLSNRLKMLELLFPYKTGTWPIIDYSYIQFNAIAEQQYITQAFLTTNSGAGQTRTAKSSDAYNAFGSLVTDTDLKNALFISYDRDSGTLATTSNYLVAYSTDIDNWATSDPGIGVGYTVLNQVAWDEYGQRWLAINSHPDNSPSAAGIIIRQTTDFITWSTLYEDNSTSTAAPYNIAFDGTGNILMTGITTGGISYAMHSTDNGVSWTYTNIQSLFATSGNVGGVRYANGLWFILGTRLTLLVSSSVSGPFVSYMSGSLFDSTRDLVYGGGRYVLTRENDDGGNVNLMYSDDGYTWTGASYTGGAGYPVQPGPHSIVYDPVFKWCVVDGSQILISDDGITWEPAPQSGSYSLTYGIYLWERPVT